MAPTATAMTARPTANFFISGTLFPNPMVGRPLPENRVCKRPGPGANVDQAPLGSLCGFGDSRPGALPCAVSSTTTGGSSCQILSTLDPRGEYECYSDGFLLGFSGRSGKPDRLDSRDPPPTSPTQN